MNARALEVLEFLGQLGRVRPPRVPVGNDLPEQGGITGTLPRPVMLQPTGAPSGGTTLPQPVNAPPGGVALSSAPRPALLPLARPAEVPNPVLAVPRPAVVPPHDETGDEYLKDVPVVPARRIDNASLLNDRAIRMAPETELETRMATRPENHNSRLAGVGLGALRGLQRGGLFGALFGALHGGMNKSADEEYANEQRMAELAPRVKFNQERQAQDVENLQRRAQAAKALQPPPVSYQHVETENGIGLFNPQTGEITPTGVKPPQKPQTPRNLQTVTRRKADGTEEVGYVDPDTKSFVPLKDEAGAVVARAPKPSLVGPDGLTPYQRAMIAIGRGDKQYQREKDTRAEARQSTEFVGKTHQYYANRLADAARIANDFENFKSGYYRALNSGDEKEKAKAQANRDAMEAARRQLEAYADVYEVGTGAGDTPYVKPKQRVSISAILRDHKGMTPDQAVQQALDNGFVPVR